MAHIKPIPRVFGALFYSSGHTRYHLPPMTPKRHSTTPHRQRSGSGAAENCTAPNRLPVQISQGPSRRASMIPRADTWRCSRLGVRAIAKTARVSAARTSDQGLRPRMVDHFNEPASRATRWALFALRRSTEGTRNPPGVGPPFVLRHTPYRRKDSRSWGDGRDGREYQLIARSTNSFDKTGHRSKCPL
jgi:hypothetical protein